MKKFKLLLVDDEKEFIQTLSERLKMRNLESNTVFDGEQAISFVKENEPDVIVLDIKMPGINGIEVLRQVKKAYPEIQVIILTGHGTDKDKEKAGDYGAFDYLEKPVDVDKLADRIKVAYREKIENLSVAATFAEAGEFETAKKIIKDDDKR